MVSKLESNVRSYSRSYPVTFSSAQGSTISSDGKEYIDFMTGAGTMIYGHNDPDMTRALVEYVSSGGVVHGLDMFTEAREKFMTTFNELILQPRNLEHMKMMFTGPTGANGVEAAIKLARKKTGRWIVAAFTNGFHGCSLGALSLTGAEHHRKGSEPLLSNVTRLPYDGYMNNSLEYIRKVLTDPSSGVEVPAAIILEIVQGEGGINVGSIPWIRGVRDLCTELGIIMIIDDIQAGCGRTGPFFSFEHHDIIPDMVVLSKGLSGYGLPFTVVLHSEELDVFKPAEHNGTFRGNNLAMVTATTMLDKYWRGNGTCEYTYWVEYTIYDSLRRYVDHDQIVDLRGVGAMIGLECLDPSVAAQIKSKAFENGLIIELCGNKDQVVKLMPPVNIHKGALLAGLDILTKVIDEVLNDCT